MISILLIIITIITLWYIYDIFIKFIDEQRPFFILPSPLLSSSEGMTGTDSIEGKFTDLHISFCSVAMPKHIENGHRNSGFSHKKIVIFHSYVKLPEGNIE